MFYNQPEKYSMQTDEFEGRVRIREGYVDPTDDSPDSAYLNVSFGFRSCKNGEWAIAAYEPDLARSSPEERRLWSGFEIADDQAFNDDDPRFRKWISRYIMGSWEVEDGPIAALDRVVEQINAVAQCAVGCPLFVVTDLRRLCFPSAQNTHRYEDAHADLYRLVVDGLNKEAIGRIANRFGIVIKAGDKRTIDALEMLFPSGSIRATVRAPLDRISEQRRRASHKERAPAQRFPAFEEFEKDVRTLIGSIELARDDLARRLDANIERCEKRASAMRCLPVFDETRPTQPNYAISAAQNLLGKHVVSVRTGEVIATPDGPEQMEAIVLEFGDGSMMSIEAATNISQIVRDGSSTDQRDLHVTFYVNYVPPMLPFSATIKTTDDTSGREPA